VADLTLPLTRRLTRPLTFPVNARGALGTGGVPTPPPGFALIQGADGQYLRGADGAYLYGRIS